MNQCIDTVTPKHLKDRKRERERGEKREGNKSVQTNVKAHICPDTPTHIKTAIPHSYIQLPLCSCRQKCPPVLYTHSHTYTVVGWIASVPSKNERLPYSGPMNLIRGCHGNIPVSMPLLFTRWRPKQTAGITHQSHSRATRHDESNAEREIDRFDLRGSTWFLCLLECVCRCMWTVNVSACTLVLKPSAFWVIR